MPRQRRLLRTDSFDKHLSLQTPPRVPSGGFLQGHIESPSFNEDQQRSIRFAEEWGGRVPAANEVFHQRFDMPGGRTFVKGDFDA